MKLYNGIFLDALGSPRPGAQLQVVVTGTVGLVPLFDANGNVMANPITTDSQGKFSFRVASGAYDFLDVNGVLVLQDVHIFDLTDIASWMDATGIPVVAPLTNLNIQAELQSIRSDMGAPVLNVYNDVLGTGDGSNINFFLTFHAVAGTHRVFVDGVMYDPVGGSPGALEYMVLGGFNEEVVFGVAPPLGAKVRAHYKKS